MTQDISLRFDCLYVTYKSPNYVVHRLIGIIRQAHDIMTKYRERNLQSVYLDKSLDSGERDIMALKIK
jgi:hypothetical protein